MLVRHGGNHPLTALLFPLVSAARTRCTDDVGKGFEESLLAYFRLAACVPRRAFFAAIV